MLLLVHSSGLCFIILKDWTLLPHQQLCRYCSTTPFVLLWTLMPHDVCEGDEMVVKNSARLLELKDTHNTFGQQQFFSDVTVHKLQAVFECVHPSCYTSPNHSFNLPAPNTASKNKVYNMDILEFPPAILYDDDNIPSLSPPGSRRSEMTLKVLSELGPWDKHSVSAYSEAGSTTRGRRGVLPSASAKISSRPNPHRDSVTLSTVDRRLEGERNPHGDTPPSRAGPVSGGYHLTPDLLF